MDDTQQTQTQTWQEIALAHGWTPPPKPEPTYKFVASVGSEPVLFVYGYGVIVPTLGITNGSFDGAAEVIASYHRWMPYHYTIGDCALPDSVDWTSAESIHDALVDYCLSDTEGDTSDS